MVTMPFRISFSSTIGIPPTLKSVISLRASPAVADSWSVIGSTIIPLSERLTFLTSFACSAMDIFLWIKPIPPSWAIATAMAYSVTVSMAAETSGILSEIVLVSCVFVFVSLGRISE